MVLTNLSKFEVRISIQCYDSCYAMILIRKAVLLLAFQHHGRVSYRLRNPCIHATGNVISAMCHCDIRHLTKWLKFCFCWHLRIQESMQVQDYHARFAAKTSLGLVIKTSRQPAKKRSRPRYVRNVWRCIYWLIRRLSWCATKFQQLLKDVERPKGWLPRHSHPEQAPK